MLSRDVHGNAGATLGAALVVEAPLLGRQGEIVAKQRFYHRVAVDDVKDYEAL